MAQEAGPIDGAFRRIFEAIPSPCLILAPDFTIVVANDAYLRVTARRRDDILGRVLFDVFPDNPDDPETRGSDRLRASLERVRSTRKPDTMPLQKYDISINNEGFEERYWSPVNAPVFDDEGGIAYFVHRVEDVTELVKGNGLLAGAEEEDQRRAELLAAEAFRRGRELEEINAQLRQANEMLAQLDRTKTDFFNDLSHELRTPLTLLLWSIEHMQRSATGLTDEQRKPLIAAKRNAQRLLRLVNSLLDFARVESGRVKASFQPTNLARFTADLAAQFRAAIEEAGLRMVVDCRPLSAPAYVDREMWEKIVFNLLSNAFKFTAEGEIRVRLTSTDDHVELTVEDTGSGIPAAEVPRVFERFYRAKGTHGRSAEGTGIGLSLVRELTRLHGGEVTVESEYGKGSRFSVTIPYGRNHLPAELVKDDRATEAPVKPQAAAESWLPAAGQSQGDQKPGPEAPRVLVVDDNADVSVAISRLLGERYQTHTIGDSAAALRDILENPPEVLVADLMMRPVSGLDLVRAVRSDPRVSALPIILVSGRATDEARSEALEAGADDYLTKPFSARELLARVGSLVEHAQRARLERSLRAEAEAARSRMNMVLESVNEAFVAVDRFWRVTFANRRAGEWLARPKEDVIDHTLSEVLGNRLQEELRTALQSAMGQRQAASLEVPLGDVWWKMDVYPSPEGVVLLASDVTERKAAEEKALHLARHDPLTGLPNRALLYELGEHTLAAARRSHSMAAVLYFDLDRFKPINDTYGHKVGDEVLKQVTRRVRQSLRKEDWLARLGGDEFVALLPHLHSARDAARAAAHALEVLRAPMQVDGIEAYSGPSIGISLFPQDGDDIDTLVQHADAAMYHAKEIGGGCYQFFTKSLGRQAQMSISIEHRLRQGLDSQGLQLHYQPVVDTTSGHLTGVEALLRWPQPDKTSISPEVFIPVAEAAGLIQPLGEWVFREACSQHHQWQREGLPPIRIAVNISPVQFRHRDFRRSLDHVLKGSNVSPTCLLLELTESALLKDVEGSVKHLSALRDSGVQIALDDFGTGYSNLSQLTQLPLDKLKIDRSFVQNLERGGPSPAIVEAIIALGRILELEVVAEGVETEESLEFLRQRNCQHAQGYYFGRAMPASEFAKWYRERFATA